MLEFAIEKGYFERGIGVSRIPVGIQVSPIGIRIEPRDSYSTSIKSHHNFSFLSELPQGSSLLLSIAIEFYGFPRKHYGRTCSPLSLVFFISFREG